MQSAVQGFQPDGDRMMASKRETAHTAEVLHLFSRHDTTAIMDANDDEFIAWMGFDRSEIPKSVHKSRARRLIAAWNACAGIETETLEGEVVLGEAALMVVHGGKLARADAAEALLSNLVMACTTGDKAPDGTHMGIAMPSKYIVETARAFLDKTGERGG